MQVFRFTTLDQIGNQYQVELWLYSKPIQHEKVGQINYPFPRPFKPLTIERDYYY